MSRKWFLTLPIFYILVVPAPFQSCVPNGTGKTCEDRIAGYKPVLLQSPLERFGRGGSNAPDEQLLYGAGFLFTVVVAGTMLHFGSQALKKTSVKK